MQPKLKSYAASLFVTLVASGPLAAASAEGTGVDRNIFCTFRPQAAICDEIYKKALTDSGPTAEAVKEAYDGYGRYVRNAHGTLTQDDKHYLSENGIRVSPDLAAEDLAGLHAVINDPALRKDPDALQIAVNNFLGRAVQAELYCGFNNCRENNLTAAADTDTPAER